jgi:hypothetical protein
VCVCLSECEWTFFQKNFYFFTQKKKMASSSSSRHVAPKFGKIAVHNFPLSYYYKVATASFVCGAAVEAFMIHTYDSLKNNYLFFFSTRWKIRNQRSPNSRSFFYSLSLSFIRTEKQRVLRKSDADRSEQTG